MSYNKKKALSDHDQRIVTAINDGYKPTGVRLAHPKTADGVVVTLYPDEAEAVAALIKKLIETRK